MYFVYTMVLASMLDKQPFLFVEDIGCVGVVCLPHSLNIHIIWNGVQVDLVSTPKPSWKALVINRDNRCVHKS